MNLRQKGFGAIQVLAAISSVALVTAVAVPKYEAFVVQSKMSEALTLANDAKTKLTEYYIMNGRFPRNEREAEAINTETFSPPEFVSKVVVNTEHDAHDIVVEVYFKRDALPGEYVAESHLFLAGNPSSNGNAMVDWSCGGEGIELKFLPSRCSKG